MPASDRRYVVVAVHWADNADNPEYLACDGKIVVFDTLAVAQEVIPCLMCGRLHAWSADNETLFALQFQPGGFNRLSIWRGYDPYDVPGGFRSKGVWSEAEGLDWRYHVYWRHALETLQTWAESLLPPEEAPFSPE